ncbi:MAG: hypothetical protein ABJL49_05445 [Parasphingorhabdus sp.]|uniref:hypothetical protein n=1 Tax=Alphaproteobacteria TaxID=28211 RepID=UPI003263A6E7
MKYWAIYGVLMFVLCLIDMGLGIWAGATGIEWEPRLPLEYIYAREIFHGH